MPLLVGGVESVTMSVGLSALCALIQSQLGVKK